MEHACAIHITLKNIDPLLNGWSDHRPVAFKEHISEMPFPPAVGFLPHLQFVGEYSYGNDEKSILVSDQNTHNLILFTAESEVSWSIGDFEILDYMEI